MKTWEDIERLWWDTDDVCDGVSFMLWRVRRAEGSNPADHKALSYAGPDDEGGFWRAELFGGASDLKGPPDVFGEGPTPQAAIEALYSAVEAVVDEKIVELDATKAKLLAAKGGRS